MYVCIYIYIHTYIYIHILYIYIYILYIYIYYIYEVYISFITEKYFAAQMAQIFLKLNHRHWNPPKSLCK